MTNWGLARELAGEEFLEVQSEVGKQRRGDGGVLTFQCALSILAVFGLAVDFDLFFGDEDEPAFFDAGGGVGFEFGTVVFVGGDADFDDEFGGVRMFGPEIFGGSVDDGDIGFGFGIDAGDGLLGAKQEPGGKNRFKQFEETQNQSGVDG